MPILSILRASGTSLLKSCSRSRSPDRAMRRYSSAISPASYIRPKSLMPRRAAA